MRNEPILSIRRIAYQIRKACWELGVETDPQKRLAIYRLARSLLGIRQLELDRILAEYRELPDGSELIAKAISELSASEVLSHRFALYRMRDIALTRSGFTIRIGGIVPSPPPPTIPTLEQAGVIGNPKF